ncbi:restless-like transposase [Purpureocillium lavendulum]|uniref:Restless-like transposase n=1 Tax=Purpureocillium lavendulum TaxID=1247861 RepID=A0AB34FJ16_9HYPO|nr:restless-like transposase [Purpureocillium lavendulum]
MEDDRRRAPYSRLDARPPLRQDPLIKEPGFLTPSECAKYEQELSRLVTPYTHNTGPTMRKVGIAQVRTILYSLGAYSAYWGLTREQFEYQAQSEDDIKNRSDEQERYFKDAKKLENFHRKLAEEKGLDAWYRVVNRIAALFPDWDVQVASEGHGRNYFSGIFRALNDSTHLHCDFSPYDSLTEDWIINSVEYQAVFNLFLAPVKDGRTTVHDVQWTKEALRYRDPKSYGYHHDLVKDALKAICEPTVGSLCMFNSRNMHEVEAVTPEAMPSLGMQYRPRLSLSSFMGLLPSSKTGGKPRLIFWS